MDIKNLNKAVVCKGNHDKLLYMIDAIKNKYRDRTSLIKEAVSCLSKASIDELEKVVLSLLEEDKTALEKEIEGLSMGISFDVSKEDQVLIGRIVDRFIAQYDPGVMEDYRTDIMMSITVCHANGCPLDLEKLCISPSPVLCHDVWGIHQHLNHETGGLVGNFWPRTAKKEQDYEKRKAISGRCL